MELLSGEVPAEPGTPTNSNNAQQSQTCKIPETSLFFSLYLLLGLAGFMATFSNAISKHPSKPNLSPTCSYDPHNIRSEVKNIYEQNFLFDLHAFISENETNFDHDGELIWKKSKLIYGDLESAFNFNTNISISEVSRVSPVDLIGFDRWILFGIPN